MKLGYYFSGFKFTRLTEAEQEEAWSHLMNLNGEAEKYKVSGEVYDNRDKTIALRMNLPTQVIQNYLSVRVRMYYEQFNKKIKDE